MHVQVHDCMPMTINKLKDIYFYQESEEEFSHSYNQKLKELEEKVSHFTSTVFQINNSIQ